MNRILTFALAVAVLAALVIPSMGQNVSKNSPARVRIESDGRVTINDQPVAPSEITAKLSEVKRSGGSVWYWRANAGGDRHPNADLVMKAIADLRLSVSLSTRRDFSDYVDENGRSRPRQ
jgi:hypothetical protein